MKAWRPGRCALCGKPREHRVHTAPRGPGILYRLLHLAWPTWMARSPGTHGFLEDRSDKVARAEHEMARLRKGGRR